MNGANPNNDPIIAEIISMWRLRQRWHRAEKSLILQGKAFCRAFTDGDKTAANELFDKARDDITSVDATLATGLMPFLDAIGTFEPKRDGIEKHLKKLVKSLPIWPFVQSVKGFGEGNLSGIIGECGDIGTYRNHSCVWKRMGLAVIDGERQRKCADLEKALAHGYNPSRRAVAFNLSDGIIRAQIRNVKDEDGKKTDQRIALGHLGELYIARKALEETRIINDKPISGIHADKRARRYIVKRALRDLYRAWRMATSSSSDEIGLRTPSASIPSAIGETSQGHRTTADALPANVQLSLQNRDAGSKISVPRKRKTSAISQTPKGQAPCADVTHSNAPSGAVSAFISSPKGQAVLADTTNPIIRKGKGRTNRLTTKKAKGKSSAPSKSVPAKAGGRAKGPALRKANASAPSRKSRVAA